MQDANGIECRFSRTCGNGEDACSSCVGSSNFMIKDYTYVSTPLERVLDINEVLEAPTAIHKNPKRKTLFKL